MHVDHPANSRQLLSAEALATSQLHRFEPELAGAALSLDVNVHRLITVEAGEEDPVWPRDARDSRHSETFAPLPVHSGNNTRQRCGLQARCPARARMQR